MTSVSLSFPATGLAADAAAAVAADVALAVVEEKTPEDPNLRGK